MSSIKGRKEVVGGTADAAGEWKQKQGRKRVDAASQKVTDA